MLNFNNPNQNLIQVAQQSNARAALFLFPPLARPFTDQAHRPLTYRMSDDLFIAAQDAAHRANMGASPVKEVMHVIERSDAMAAVMPSFIPMTRIGLSEMSSKWKFMLVVNGDHTAPGQVSTWSRNVDGRVIYFGYCMEEPLNPLTLGSDSPTVNDHARLMISHKTLIQSYPTHSAQSSVPRFNTMFDTDIIDPHVATLLSSTALQVNDPLHLSLSSDLTTGNDGSTFASPIASESNNLTYAQGPVAIDNKMHDPQSNLTALLNSALQANLKLTSNRQLGRDSPFTENYTRGDILTESMQSYYQSGTASVKTVGLRPDEVHTMHTIRQRYAPDIFPVGSDRSVMLSPYDQETRSATAMFCSLLCSAIPPLLMQAQLLHFAFQYESRSYDTNQPDAWRVFECQSAIQMSDALQRQKIEAVMTALKTGLFRMMLESQGDFSLHGSFGVANVSHCYLNFYCNTERMVDPFEVPTIFGGLTSSLLADPATTVQNTSQYSMLMTAMTGGQMSDFVPEMQDKAPYYSQSSTPAVGTAPAPIIPAGLIRL